MIAECFKNILQRSVVQNGSVAVHWPAQAILFPLAVVYSCRGAGLMQDKLAQELVEDLQLKESAVQLSAPVEEAAQLASTTREPATTIDAGETLSLPGAIAIDAGEISTALSGPTAFETGASAEMTEVEIRYESSRRLWFYIWCF